MNAMNKREPEESAQSLQQSRCEPTVGWDAFEVWQRFFQRPRAQRMAQVSSVNNLQAVDISAARVKFHITSVTRQTASAS